MSTIKYQIIYLNFLKEFYNIIILIFTSLLLILHVGDTTVLFGILTCTGDKTGGTNDDGNFLGRVILLRLRTTKCIASLNSASESAPSLVTSDNCLKKR